MGRLKNQKKKNAYENGVAQTGSEIFSVDCEVGFVLGLCLCFLGGLGVWGKSRGWE